eukprot:scaffold195678_cov14-Tisochrysis_lutea.AAC.1
MTPGLAHLHAPTNANYHHIPLCSVGSKHVRAVSAEEAESMYMALCERTNEQHVLLIIYTPGCPQCKQMESE